MEEGFKFNIGQTVYYDSVINTYLGEVISRKKKNVGWFKPTLKNVYLVQDIKTHVIFEYNENNLWSLH